MPTLVQMALLYASPVGYLERCRRRLGPIFCMSYPGSPPFVVVTEPKLARELYKHDRDTGHAGAARAPYLTPLVGEHSLLCLEGDEWEQQRRLVAPPLHGERVTGWGEQIAAIADAELDGWPVGEPFALHPRMQAITLEVILRLVFGVEDARRLERLRVLFPALLDQAQVALLLPGLRRVLERPGLARLPGNPLRRFLRLRGEIDELLYEQIAQRRAEGSERLEARDDLLSMLLLSRDEDGGAMTDGELRDELVTLLAAGHETTANALAWSFERLTRHPDVLRRVRDELAGEETGYLDAVIKEVLRSRPIVYDTPRELSRPLELGGYEVPQGWIVSAALPLVHRSGDVFPDPDSFDPDRFLGDETPAAGWMPFGGGRRRCVGSRLALLELHTIIGAVLTRFEIEAPEAAPERQHVRGVGLAPAKGARVVVRPAA